GRLRVALPGRAQGNVLLARGRQPLPHPDDQHPVQHDPHRHGDLLQGLYRRRGPLDQAPLQPLGLRPRDHRQEPQAGTPDLRGARRVQWAGVLGGEEDHLEGRAHRPGDPAALPPVRLAAGCRVTERGRPMSDAAIAVDLGGTNIRAALVTRDGAIRHLIRRPTLAQEGPEAVIDRIVALITEVADREGADTSIPVGLSAPGPLNPTAGVVYFATNMPGWDDIPIRDILQQRTQRAVMIGNDGNNAALGEAMFGVARGVQHMIYIALGTGVGGGIISHGQLIEGTRGLGGEVGHVSIDPSGPRCHCGGIGCVEAYAAGWAIARDGELLVHSERSRTIAEIAAGGPITAAVVAEAARAGDPAARAVYERAGRALGVGLAGFVNLFNPDVRIERSALGAHTGIVGAAARVFYTESGNLGAPSA